MAGAVVVLRAERLEKFCSKGLLPRGLQGLIDRAQFGAGFRLAASPWFRPAALIVFGCLLFIQGGLLLAGIPKALQGNSDFEHLYTAGYMVRTGHGQQLYDYGATDRFEVELIGPTGSTPPFNHLSYEALIFIPLSFFKYRIAYSLFLFLDLFLLALVFVLLRRYGAAYGPLWKPIVYVPFICFLPFAFAMIQGQDSFLLLTALVCSFVAMERKRDFLSGAILALGLFKFQFVLPIALLFALWKKWRVVAGFGSTALILSSLSLEVTGYNSWKTYSIYLLSMSARLTEAGRGMYGILPERMANLRGLISAMMGTFVPQTVLQATIALASILLVLWATRKRPSFALAVSVSFLVSYHAYTYDEAILILPLVASASAFMASSSLWRIASGGILLVAPTAFLLARLPLWLGSIPIAFFLAAVAGGSGQVENIRAARLDLH